MKPTTVETNPPANTPGARVICGARSQRRARGSRRVHTARRLFAAVCAALTLIALTLIALTLVAPAPAASRSAGARDDGDVFRLSAEQVERESVWLDNSKWRYRFSDDLAWAARDYDDSSWETSGFDDHVRAAGDFKRLGREREPAPGGGRWDGRAWFRFRLAVDERLAGRPLALRAGHWGASEIYIDGVLVKRFGVIEFDRDVEQNPRWQPVNVVFAEGGVHTVAVRYSFLAWRGLSFGVGRWYGVTPGVGMSMRAADEAAVRYASGALAQRGTYLFVGVLAALALLHLLLYLFYRREPGNLFYSLFAAALAAALPLNTYSDAATATGATTAFLSGVGFVLYVCATVVALVSLLTFLYVASGERFGRAYRLTLLSWAATVIAVALFLRHQYTFYIACFGVAVTLADGARVMRRALARRLPGAWIIATGFILFGSALCVELGADLLEVSTPPLVSEALQYVFLLALPVTVSVYLARNFARTSRSLEAQLANVKELSARELDHERERAELRLKHEQERAENERRARELEEARQLQLSMLPKLLPELPNLEIAAYMKPASEVGGDYYDFHVSTDGTLTVAVGDATGHGLKAGTVVTATKSLFNAYAAEPDIRTFFRESSRALKAMNLRGLYMAMAVLKWDGARVRAVAAGMPYPLLYRAATRRIEEVKLKGMPLGSMPSFPYEQVELPLAPGDCLVLMSDGFPERFNPRGEMMEDDTARGLLAEVAHLAPGEIIERFVREGERWADGRPQDDDVTFVVIKIKNGDL